MHGTLLYNIPLFVPPLPIGATCEVGFLCEFPMQGLKSPMQLARWTHNSSYHEGFRNRICKLLLEKMVFLWSQVNVSTSFNFCSGFHEQLIIQLTSSGTKTHENQKPLEQNGRSWSHQWFELLEMAMVETEKKALKISISSLKLQTTCKMWSDS